MHKATAKALGIDRVTLYRWARKQVPAEKLVEIEKVTGIPRHDLRPDLFVMTTTSPSPEAA